MKAIILTAGFGRRMQPITHTTHKTLLPIGGRAILEWIVDGLVEYNIRDLAVVTGYRAEDVRGLLDRRYPDLAIQYIHNERFAETNNIYSLALAFEQIEWDDDVLLIESDLIFEPAVLGRLLASPHPNAALVDRYRRGMDGTVVQLDGEVITDVIPPHRQGAAFNFSDKYKTLNIYRFSRHFCAGELGRLLSFYARAIDDNCYYELVLGILIYLQRQVIHAEVVQGERWAEIDDPNDLASARYLFEPSSRRAILERSHGGYWSYDFSAGPPLLDFAYLRNFHFPTPSIFSELREHLPALLTQYGSSQGVLEQKLAWFLACDPTRVAALNGLSQLYPILGNLLADRRVLIPAPTFGEYARIFPAADSYRDEPGVDWKDLTRRARTAEVVGFVNPNNPTGATLPTEQIYDFAAAHPHTRVLVDESFLDFSDQPSLLPRLEKRPLNNLLLLKSLSKGLGVPGLRLGFLYTSDSVLLAQIRQQIPIWNLNSVAEYFVEILLKHRNELTASFRRTAQDRDAFAADLARLPQVQKVYPSGGNFLLISLACTGEECSLLTTRLLQAENIFVKELTTQFGGEAHLRVAVHLPEENERFLAALERLWEARETPEVQQLAEEVSL